MSQPASNDGTIPRNPVKVAHLVFGCFFVGIAILWALTESDTITWQGTSYLVPLTLLLAGAIGLGASLLGSAADRRRRTTRSTASSPSTPATSYDEHDTTVLPTTVSTDSPEEEK